ncbi:protein TRC8 homolog [Liolophura sinensis]|uniref:protein TRC8 homolog n=1 Tax=Liolophura sinensis TaxID=3198878 RepID=UPI0031585BFF
MSWREPILPIADVVLRVPPLFVMDSVLNGSFFTLPIITTSIPLLTIAVSVSFIAALALFCLSAKQLLDVYNYLVSTAILCVSAWWNLQYLVESKASLADQPEATGAWYLINKMTVISASHSENGNQQRGNFGMNFAIQLSLALIFVLLRSQGPLFRMMRNSPMGVSMFQGSVYISLTLPIICGAEVGLSWQLPLLAVGLPTVYMLVELFLYYPYIVRSLSDGYSLGSQAIRTYGIQVFIEGQWIRLHIPVVLQTFWLTRCACHVVFYAWVEMYETYLESGEIDYFNADLWTVVGKQSLIRGCETIIAVLGLTSLVSYIAHYIGIFMAFCICSNNEEDKNMGTVSAILFFILALQTGLTSLEPEKRLVRLYRNFCLLFTALLHFVHSMVNPLLLSLSASRNQSVSRHVRVLTMCLFLVIFPAWLLFYLWSDNSVSTWLLAVTAFSVEVIIKVAFSLMVYLLFLIDAYRDGFWEKLDDYVYYVKSAGSTIEFLFGIFLFCNGGWIMIFESGGTIRAIMMCIHAYFNIWLQAKKGWQIFIKRRTAVQKINSLPEASREQLEEVNDICAICYSELNSARITRCRHFFHGVCLRKWLYVQDRCPLCHELIYAPEQNELDSPSSPDGSRAGSEGGEQRLPAGRRDENNTPAESEQRETEEEEEEETSWEDFELEEEVVIAQAELILAQHFSDHMQSSGADEECVRTDTPVILGHSSHTDSTPPSSSLEYVQGMASSPGTGNTASSHLNTQTERSNDHLKTDINTQYNTDGSIS